MNKKKTDEITNIPISENYIDNTLQTEIHLKNDSISAVSKNDLARAYEKRGDYYLADGKVEKAKEEYEKSYSIRGNNKNKFRTAESIDQWLKMCTKLGKFLEQYGEIDKARECYLEYLEYKKELAIKTRTVSTIEDMLDAYEQYGSFLCTHGEIEKGKQYLNESLLCRKYLVYGLNDVLENIYLFSGNKNSNEFSRAQENALKRDIKSKVNNNRNLPEIRNLAITYEKIGEALLTEGNAAQARTMCYDISKPIKEWVVKKTGSKNDSDSLSDTYEKYGLIYEMLGDGVNAREYYNNCALLREELVNDRGTEDDRRKLCRVYQRIGDLSAAEGHMKDAMKHYYTVFQIYEILANESSDKQAKRDLSASSLKLGEFYISEKEYSSALNYLQRSIEIDEDLISLSPVASDYLRLADSYSKASEAVKEVDTNDEDSKEYREQLSLQYKQKSLSVLNKVIENE